MEPKIKVEYDRITNQQVKTGYGESQHHKVAEYLNQGKLAFSLDYSFPFNADNLYLSTKYAPDENGKGPYQQEVYAVMRKNIDIPELNIGGVNTGELNYRLQNPPSPEFVTPENQHEYTQLEQQRLQQVSTDLKTLMEQKPDIFVRFMEKHHPLIDFEVSPELIKQQQQLREEHKVAVTISSYFNLTPLEIYNALRFDRAINKDLFRKPREGEPTEQRPDGKIQNITYNAWVKPDLGQPLDEKGRVQMKMWTKEWGFSLVRELDLFNFREMKSDNLGRNDKIYFMKKGAAVTFTNSNPTGERQVKAIANPEIKRVELYKLNGEKILNQKDYLKKPVISEAQQYRRNNNQQREVAVGDLPSQVNVIPSTPIGQNSNAQLQQTETVKDQNEKQNNQGNQITGDDKGQGKGKDTPGKGDQGKGGKNADKNRQHERRHLNNDRTVSSETKAIGVGR